MSGSEFAVLFTRNVINAPAEFDVGREQTSHPSSFRGAKSENTLVSIIEMFVGLNPKENQHASICHCNHSRGHDARTRGYGLCPVEG